MYTYITALAIVLLALTTPAAAHVDAQQEPVVGQDKPTTFSERHQRIQALWRKSRRADDPCQAYIFARQAREKERRAIESIRSFQDLTGRLPETATQLLAAITIRNQPGEALDLSLLAPKQCDIEIEELSSPAS